VTSNVGASILNPVQYSPISVRSVGSYESFSSQGTDYSTHSPADTLLETTATTTSATSVVVLGSHNPGYFDDTFQVADSLYSNADQSQDSSSSQFTYCNFSEFDCNFNAGAKANHPPASAAATSVKSETASRHSGNSQSVSTTSKLAYFPHQIHDQDHRTASYSSGRSVRGALKAGPDEQDRDIKSVRSEQSMTQSTGGGTSNEWLRGALSDLAVGKNFDRSGSVKNSSHHESAKRDRVDTSWNKEQFSNSKIRGGGDGDGLSTSVFYDGDTPPIPLRDYQTTRDSDFVQRVALRQTAEVKPFSSASSEPPPQSSSNYANLSELQQSGRIATWYSGEDDQPTKSGNTASSRHAAASDVAPPFDPSRNYPVADTSMYCNIGEVVAGHPRLVVQGGAGSRGARTSLLEAQASSSTVTPEIREMVRQVRHQVHGVKGRECHAALLNNQCNVDATVKQLKLDQLVRLGMKRRDSCQALLEKYRWNLEMAASALMEEVTNGSSV